MFFRLYSSQIIAEFKMLLIVANRPSYYLPKRLLQCSLLNFFMPFEKPCRREARKAGAPPCFGIEGMRPSFLSGVEGKAGMSSSSVIDFSLRSVLSVLCVVYRTTIAKVKLLKQRKNDWRRSFRPCGLGMLSRCAPDDHRDDRKGLLTPSLTICLWVADAPRR